jgi:hypothetical protein
MEAFVLEERICAYCFYIFAVSVKGLIQGLKESLVMSNHVEDYYVTVNVIRIFSERHEF